MTNADTADTVEAVIADMRLAATAERERRYDMDQQITDADADEWASRLSALAPSGAAEALEGKKIQPEGACKCGAHTVPEWADGVQWYWQRHARDTCTLELPNLRCWCGLLRSEHVKGHADTHPEQLPTPPAAGVSHGEAVEGLPFPKTISDLLISIGWNSGSDPTHKHLRNVLPILKQMFRDADARAAHQPEEPK